MRRSRTLVSLIALSFVLSACGSSSSDSGSGSNAGGQDGVLAPYDAAKAGGTNIIEVSAFNLSTAS